MADQFSPIVILDTKIVRAASYDIESIGRIQHRLLQRGLTIAAARLVSRFDFLANRNIVELIYYKDTPISAPFIRRSLLTPDGLLQIRELIRNLHERDSKRTP